MGGGKREENNGIKGREVGRKKVYHHTKKKKNKSLFLTMCLLKGNCFSYIGSIKEKVSQKGNLLIITIVLAR